MKYSTLTVVPLLSWGSLIVLSGSLGCGGSQPPHEEPGAGGGADATGGHTGGAGGRGGGTGGRRDPGGDGGNSSGGVPPQAGPPGCGLEAAAFCESFDEVATEKGRAGDLDKKLWSAGRLMPQLPTLPDPFPIGPAKAPAGCRDGLGSLLLPPEDMLICAPTDGVPSSHAWIAAAAQNYGVSSIRPRQPFDFQGRTGKIVFDAELATRSMLSGFLSVAITEDPTNATSYAIDQNVEGGAVPRNGITFQFANPCSSSGVHLSSIIIFREYEQEIHDKLNGPCISASRGELRHIEIEVSASKVAVFAGPVAGTPNLIEELTAEAPMTRGYLQLNVHNHATIKYSSDASDPELAWSVRIDNVGFDGPVIDDYREYEYADAQKKLTQAIENGTEYEYVAIGHRLRGESQFTKFEFDDVDPEGMGRALAAFSFWSLHEPKDEAAVLYKWNGGAVQTQSVIVATDAWGAIALSLDIPINEVKKGKNTLEFATKNVDMNYPPAIANLDLVLTPD